MIAGFTGHQNLGPPDVVTWVERTLAVIIKEKNVTLGLSSLAEGADQVFASVLVREHIPFRAVIPARGYENTFSAEHLAAYESLLRSARSVDVLSFDEPSEAAYYEAGTKIVSESDFLIAVWNGEKARGFGGTADIVNYAKAKRRLVVHVNPNEMSVGHLTPSK
jgi:hypothetical protein